MATGRNWLVVALCGVAVIAAGVMFVYLPQKSRPGALLKPGDRNVVVNGEAIYADNCAACHGPDLEGQENWQTPGEDGLMPAPPHNESGHTWHHSDALLIKITKFGLANLENAKAYKTAMPVYESILSDAEIVAVLSFIKSRWPAKVRERHDQLNRATADRSSQ